MTGYTDTSIANLALARLNEAAITDFNQQNNDYARWFKTNYAHVRDELLSLALWNFARARALLPASTQAPAFGWKFSYPLPHDCLYPLPIFDETGDEIALEIEGEAILTDEKGPLQFRYIRRMTDPAKFSQSFINVFVVLLAARAAHKVTAKRTYVETLLREFERTLNAAAMAEDLQNTASGVRR